MNVIKTKYDKANELLNKLDFEDGKFEITDALIEMYDWAQEQFEQQILENETVINDLKTDLSNEVNKLAKKTIIDNAAKWLATKVECYVGRNYDDQPYVYTAELLKDFKEENY